jgi:hypothetical protein
MRNPLKRSKCRGLSGSNIGYLRNDLTDGERPGIPKTIFEKSTAWERSLKPYRSPTGVVKIACPTFSVRCGVFKGMELELKSRVLGPMGATVASTKTNAELLRREKDLGQWKGKLADLILVNGDPLKDVRLFQQYQEKLPDPAGRVYKNILIP